MATRWRRLAAVALICALLGGCGLLPDGGPGAWFLPADPEGAGADGPNLREPPPLPVDDPVPYVLSVQADPPDADLVNRFLAVSQLEQLRDTLPDGRLDLERRVETDAATALKLLRAEGYYDGRVLQRIDWEAEPVRVDLTLVREQPYTLGENRVSYVPAPSPNAPSPSDTAAASPLPTQLYALASGAPAQAQTVLDAVDFLAASVRDQGYPLAELTEKRFEIDRSSRTLDTLVTVRPGPRVRMGKVRLEGAPNVRASFVERLAPWTAGEVWWDSEKTSTLQERLRQTGLFQTVRVEPDVADSTAGASLPGEALPSDPLDGFGPVSMASLHDGNLLPVRVVATEALPRTVSGGLKYASDVGFGVQGTWEHRNLWGEGERLHLSMPLSQERQEFSAVLTKPFVGDLNQRLLAETLMLNEDNEAYSQTAALAGLGVERDYSRVLKGSVRLTVEGGRLDDALHPRTSYAMLGLPLKLYLDGTDDLLNPTKGSRWQASMGPYTGRYAGDPFTAVRLWVEASTYVAPLRSDRLVLAARAAAGSLLGSGALSLPPSLRFYAGGGGSVRGYKYRSLGAKDYDGEPLGGTSVTEMSLEARVRVSESVSLVPFVDGGAVYNSTMPEWGRDLYIGAGLGLRYHSPIGPLRFDVAVPLRSAPDGSNYQLYISIGQAF